MLFWKCRSGRIEIDLLEDILDSKRIPFKRLKSLNCENLPVMFEGTNLDKPKPSVQNTRAANLQGDSKLARFNHLKNLNFAFQKNNEIICFLILKGCPMILLPHTDIGKRIHMLRFGVAFSVLDKAAPMPMVPSMSQGDGMLEMHRNPNDYWHKLSTSTENRLSYSENVSRR